jgi:2'-5' RNA ligase
MSSFGNDAVRRLFLAVPPMDADRQALASCQERARALPALVPFAQRCRWIDPRDWHLTLHFLGAVPPDRIEALVEGLRRIAWGPVTVGGGSRQALDRWFPFPRPSAATVLAAGSDVPCPALAEIHRSSGRCLESLGFTPESRRYLPHLTLARFRGPIPLDLQRETLPPVGMGIGSLALFESRRDPSGSRYEMIQEFTLPLSPGP